MTQDSRHLKLRSFVAKLLCWLLLLYGNPLLALPASVEPRPWVSDWAGRAADPDPAAVLAAIGGAYQAVFAYDACDSTDPWKLYDPADPAASDLTAIDHHPGLWLEATQPVELPSDGTLPATTTFQLCVGWNLIGFPAGQPRHLLDNWTLSHRMIGESDWVEIASQPYPVEAAKLGTFDPTLLLNGLYELRLQAVDVAGQQVETSIAVSVEGRMKIGHFTLSFVDLAIPLSGLDIEIVRTYDSRRRDVQGDFGYGWSSYDDLNRLTSLSTTTSVGQVVQSYAYTLGPAGNRTRIDEQDGTVRSYVSGSAMSAGGSI